MDQFQPSGNPYGQPQQYYNPYSSKHSERMAIASMTLICRFRAVHSRSFLQRSPAAARCVTPAKRRLD